jgi:hypothetical protein
MNPGIGRRALDLGETIREGLLVLEPGPGFAKGEGGRQPRRDSHGLSATDFRGLWRQEHTRSRSSGLICNPKGGRTIGGRGRHGFTLEAEPSQGFNMSGGVFSLP